MGSGVIGSFFMYAGMVAGLLLSLASLRDQSLPVIGEGLLDELA